MIYKIEKLPTGPKDKKYQFALGSNNGVAILSFDKKDLKQKLEGEKYLEGKVINNLIVSRNHILAFQHASPTYALIDRGAKRVQ